MGSALRDGVTDLVIVDDAGFRPCQASPTMVAAGRNVPPGGPDAEAPMTRSRPITALVCGLIVTGPAFAGEPGAGRTARRPARPVHTYSIVARDPKTGELGVAVQSHWFAVGPLVAW